VVDKDTHRILKIDQAMEPLSGFRSRKRSSTFLNEYFDLMVHVLFEHQGTLDKSLADGLLALFGTPLAPADHARRAVQAALGIQRGATALNTVRRHGQPGLHLGIDINSGAAIVGDIGAEKRMEYAVVGNMVNVAQRLQTHAGGGEILIGSNLFPHVQHLVSVYNTVEMQVKGRQQPVQAHRIGPLQP
jgi:class 3 adenylate cyclase